MVREMYGLVDWKRADIFRRSLNIVIYYTFYVLDRDELNMFS